MICAGCGTVTEGYIFPSTPLCKPCFHRLQKPDLAALVDKLEQIKKEYGLDFEAAHSKADDALIDYIGDAYVKAAYDAIDKWYA